MSLGRVSIAQTKTNIYIHTDNHAYFGRIVDDEDNANIIILHKSTRRMAVITWIDKNVVKYSILI